MRGFEMTTDPDINYAVSFVERTCACGTQFDVDPADIARATGAGGSNRRLRLALCPACRPVERVHPPPDRAPPIVWTPEREARGRSLSRGPRCTEPSCPVRYASGADRACRAHR
jgi:hypothetical protein